MDAFGRRIATGLPGRRAAAGAAVAWTPVALLVGSAMVPALHLPILAIVAFGAVACLGSAPTRRPAGPLVAWAAALPIAVSLTWGLVPDPRVVAPGACDNVLVAPVVRRVAQAATGLGVVAILAFRLGGASTLGIRMPESRLATLLAILAPVLVPIGLVVGPVVARPFFGDVHLGLPSAAALVPAGVLAIANAALEETIYRGALQRWGAAALGARGALLAQALAFGSAHMGPDTTGGAVFLWAGMVAAGLVAGVIADRTRSLLLTFAAHAAIDVPLALALTCRLG